ncbi:MAG: hypothetical protein R2828_24450 [Saprospiraceae bacterium]
MPYYKIIDGQPHDRKLLELAEELIQGKGDGRISRQDAQQLWTAVQDGKRITSIETKSLLYIFSHFNFTDSAAEWLSHQMALAAPIELPNQIQNIILDEYDLQGLTFDYQEVEIEAQQGLTHNKIPFIRAFRMALDTILTDGKNAESPRNIIIEVYGLFQGEVEEVEAKIQANIRAHLRSGTLSLLPNIDWSDRDKDYDFNPPENGETAEDNWIFGLSLPDLSDHFYWIIIDRRQQNNPYIYGFN